METVKVQTRGYKMAPVKFWCYFYTQFELTNFIEVEGKFAGHGAVESALEEAGPEGLVHGEPAALVVLANPCHPRVDFLAAVHVLHGSLPEEEENVVLVLERVNEVGGCRERVSFR